MLRTYLIVFGLRSLVQFFLAIVAVWKKDGILCLCCNYRQLNSKIRPDRHQRIGPSKGLSLVASIKRVTTVDCIYQSLAIAWTALCVSAILLPPFYGKLSFWLQRSVYCSIPRRYPSLFKEVWRSSETYKANCAKTTWKAFENEGIKWYSISEMESIFMSYCLSIKILVKSR